MLSGLDSESESDVNEVGDIEPIMNEDPPETPYIHLSEEEFGGVSISFLLL